jgi:hypothetical protein
MARLIYNRAVREGARDTGMSIKEYILDGPDPMSVAVLVEDSIAVRAPALLAQLQFLAPTWWC